MMGKNHSWRHCDCKVDRGNNRRERTQHNMPRKWMQNIDDMTTTIRPGSRSVGSLVWWILTWTKMEQNFGKALSKLRVRTGVSERSTVAPRSRRPVRREGWPVTMLLMKRADATLDRCGYLRWVKGKTNRFYNTRGRFSLFSFLL